MNGPQIGGRDKQGQGEKKIEYDRQGCNWRIATCLVHAHTNAAKRDSMHSKRNVQYLVKYMLALFVSRQFMMLIIYTVICPDCTTD